MPRGRRPGPGTSEEKAAIRRERVRLNVQAFRRRKAGEEGNQVAKNKSKIRWVSDSKWQSEYDEKQRQADESGEDLSLTDTAATPSVSDRPMLADEEAYELSLVMLPRTPDLGRQYSHALLASLPARFLPQRVSIPSIPSGFIKIRTPCALWVTSACALAQTQDYGPLKDVLLSIVMALASSEQSRPDLAVTSQGLYTRSLFKTRRTLQPIIEGHRLPIGTDIAGVFLACHAAAVFELFVNGSLEDMARHVKGIGFLIQHLQNHPEVSDANAAIGDSLIEEYRMLQMNFSMMSRQPSTTYQNSLNVNSGRNRVTSIFTDLLDLADQIPPIMVELDKLRPKQRSDSMYCAERLGKLIPVLCTIHSELSSWSNILREKLIEKSLGDIFGANEVGLNLSAITSYEFASTWMFSCSYDCYAIETCIEALDFLDSLEKSPGRPRSKASPYRTETLRSDLISNAGGIIDIMPYFMQHDKGIIGRSIAIWPLEGAWATLESEEKRLRRDEAQLDQLDVNADIELKIKVHERKVQVMKYLKLCRDVETSAARYGLPMFKQR